MTVRRKLLLLVYVPVIVSTISAVVISSYKIRKQGIENLEDKSEAILDISIQEYCLNHIDASSIIEQEEEAQMGKKLHNYNFRISSLDPENPKHNASSKDIEFIDHFEKEKNNQINYIDNEND
ncbi:MAG: DUF3365 domain-containing protein [Bacteroidales bacterium]|nr:DUF3365 domain-containing protein [Bacteroidales bacterium]